MLNIKVNQKNTFQLEVNNKGEFQSGNQLVQWDVRHLSGGHYHIIKNKKSYTVELIHFNEDAKTMKIRVNSTEYQVEVKDKFDDLLRDLGMDKSSALKVNEIKAPMPGLVLNIHVGEGAEVKKGEPILVLEAMKMENILKSPVDGKIKKIHVSKGLPIEKGQILVSFA